MLKIHQIILILLLSQCIQSIEDDPSLNTFKNNDNKFLSINQDTEPFANITDSLNYRLSSRLWKNNVIILCPTQSIIDWKCGSLCDEIEKPNDFHIYYNSSQDSSYFIYYNKTDNSIISTFRGTEPGLYNVINDLDIYKVKYDRCEDCYVHRGFIRTYHSLQDDFIENLKQYINKYPDAKHVISGYSLGASLAVFALDDIMNYYKLGDVKAMITFGQPRIGNQQFADYVDRMLSDIQYAGRLTHQKDLVPHVPLQSFGFQHNGYEFHFEDQYNKKFVFCESQEDPKCANQYKFTSLNIYDHFKYMTIFEHDYDCGQGFKVGALQQLQAIE